MPVTRPTPTGVASDWGEDTIYCEAECAPEDVFYQGSEDEDYDDADARRQRYEAAGQRFLSGSIPYLLSTSLRGPFDSSSGWSNPWKSKLRTKCQSTTSPININPAASRRQQHHQSPVRQATNRLGISDSLECHLPSPESLKQATVTQPHPFLASDEVAAVVHWRAKLPSSSLHAEVSWFSSPVNKGSKKKRRESSPGTFDTFNGKRRKMNCHYSHAGVKNENGDHASFHSTPAALGQTGEQSISAYLDHEMSDEESLGSQNQLSAEAKAAATLSSPTSMLGTTMISSLSPSSPTPRRLNGSPVSVPRIHGTSSARHSIYPHSSSYNCAGAALTDAELPDNTGEGGPETQQDESFCYKLRSKIDDTRSAERDCSSGLVPSSPGTAHSSVDSDSWSGISHSGDAVAHMSKAPNGSAKQPAPPTVARYTEPDTQEFEVAKSGCDTIGPFNKADGSMSSAATGDERSDCHSKEPPKDGVSALIDYSSSRLDKDLPLEQLPVLLSVEAIPVENHSNKHYPDEASVGAVPLLPQRVKVPESQVDACEEAINCEFPEASARNGSCGDNLLSLETSTPVRSSAAQQNAKHIITTASLSPEDSASSAMRRSRFTKSPSSVEHSTSTYAGLVNDVVPSTSPRVTISTPASPWQDEPTLIASQLTIADGGISSTESIRKSLQQDQTQSPWIQSQRSSHMSTISTEDLCEGTPRKGRSSAGMIPPELQSPWARGTEPLPSMRGNSMLENGESEKTGLASGPTLATKRNDPHSEAVMNSVDSARDRPSTPEPQFPIRSFASFMTPSPERLPRRRELPWSTTDDKNCNAHGILASALKNPWRSSSSRRRVSWAILPHEESQTIRSTTEKLPIARSQAEDASGRDRAASPPPSISIAELPASTESKFSKHFSAVASRKKGIKPSVSRSTPSSAHNFESKQEREDTSVMFEMESSEGSGMINDQETTRRTTSGQKDLYLEKPMDIVDDLFREIGDVLQTWDLDTELDEAKDTEVPRASQMEHGLFGQW